MERIDGYTSTALGNQFTEGNGSTIPPTTVPDAWLNAVQEENMALIEAAGLLPDSADNTQKLAAIKRFANAHVTTLDSAGSPYTLTLDNAGLILVDASAGDVDFILPAATLLRGCSFTIIRTDITSNIITATPGGTNTIDGFSTLTISHGAYVIVSDGINDYKRIKPREAGEVGEVKIMAHNIVPEDFLVLDGSVISRALYPELFALLGETWGAGDGSTTFGIPDARGEFIRVLDDGRGVDQGRILGSYQSDQVGPHSHSITVERGAAISPFAGISGAQTPLDSTYTYFTNDNPGAETRPRNIALMLIIRFR